MAGPGAAASGVEGVESFRRRARGWLAANLPPARPTTGALLRGHRSDEDELEEVARQRGGTQRWPGAATTTPTSGPGRASGS